MHSVDSLVGAIVRMSSVLTMVGPDERSNTAAEVEILREDVWALEECPNGVGAWQTMREDILQQGGEICNRIETLENQIRARAEASGTVQWKSAMRW